MEIVNFYVVGISNLKFVQYLRYTVYMSLDRKPHMMSVRVVGCDMSVKQNLSMFGGECEENGAQGYY
jgi:hypothetical protein